VGTDSLLQYFNQTTAELEKQVAGLSEAQLNLNQRLTNGLSVNALNILFVQNE
jgi:hypothetical protein